jgi:flagellar hook protein FlgE
VFSQRLSEFSTNSSASQIGSGVSLASVSSSFGQGNIDSTGQPYDMAIDGSGFFLVRDTSNNATYATRAGDFRADANGFLTTSEGMRVQGEIPGSPGVSSDIKITLNPTAPALPADTEAVSWRIESNGDVNLTLRSTLVPPPATPPRSPQDCSDPSPNIPGHKWPQQGGEQPFWQPSSRGSRGPRHRRTGRAGASPLAILGAG